ncbi:transposase [Roseateles sp. SL47]|uniref:transposase n=1 Tax=Roseateles sp. SL47 TaxID=2995138 RepID=UPI00227132DD|nr:transposase [Roseateles sp. SL47]WAC72458.1 transposase [Roseateles sp. SL47]
MRKRRPDHDAAGEYAPSVSMQTLDKELSRHVEMARSKPVPVDRYGVPWVWIVSHPVWMAVDHLKALVPPEHPLVHLREAIDNTLAFESRFIAELEASCRSGLEGRMLVRAWLLQVVYSLPDPRRVREGMGYNMLWRWFVGYSLRSDPLPDPQAFEQDLNRVCADAHAVDIVWRCLNGSAFVTDDHEEFRINRGLLQALRAHHIQAAAGLEGVNRAHAAAPAVRLNEAVGSSLAPGGGLGALGSLGSLGSLGRAAAR